MITDISEGSKSYTLIQGVSVFYIIESLDQHVFEGLVVRAVDDESFWGDTLPGTEIPRFKCVLDS